MEAAGFIEPETVDDVRAFHERCGPMAKDVVREIALALGISVDEYHERVTDTVVRTGQDVLFGSLLLVRSGSVAEFDRWLARERYDGYSVDVEGSEHVDRRAWHTAPFAEQITAVTFNVEREAAVSTVRRQAYGRLYRDVVRQSSD